MSRRCLESSVAGCQIERRVLLCLVAAAVVLLLIMPSVGTRSNAVATSPPYGGVPTKIVDAFLSIHEAGVAGADDARLRELSSKLNQALNMTLEAQELEEKGRSSEASILYGKIAVVCDELIAQGHLVRDDALLHSNYQRTVAFTLAPLLALVTASASYFGFRWWRKSEVERIFQMEITLEKKRKDDA